MSVEALRSRIGDYGKDMRLNLGTVLTTDGAPDLTLNQIFGVALASAYATRDTELIQGLLAESAGKVSPEEGEAARTAATLMAMTNVYYRFTHLAEDGEVAKLPARLRMNAIGNPGIPKADFELYCLAVSAINGCGMCIKSHTRGLKDHGLSPQAIQSAVRIAAVLHGAAQALTIARLG